MKTTCPNCGTARDIADAEVLSAAARISAKRRKSNGGPTPEQAASAGRKGAESRWRHSGSVDRQSSIQAKLGDVL